ncbi:MAG TPA: hypothetical protein VF041_12175 [Gemmatimonadaceae bacterium]
MAVLALAGCSSDTGTGVNAGPLTQSQLVSIGNSVASEAEGAAALMTMGNLTNPVISSARVLRGPRVSAMQVSGLLAPFSATTDPNCPAYDPDPYADTDHDGVPDQVTLHFACHSVDSQSGYHFNVTGDVSVDDPAPSDSGFTLTASATNFNVTISTADSSLSVSQVRNGMWNVEASDGGLSETWNLRSVVAVTGQPNLTIDNAWSAVFVPATAGSVQMGAPLPAGSFTAQGSIGVNDGAGGQFALTLSTASPLVFSPQTCAGQASSFTSGEVHAAVTVNGQHGYVRVVWVNCQSPGYVYVQTNQ